jgi:hypothetical protein
MKQTIEKYFEMLLLLVLSLLVFWLVMLLSYWLMYVIFFSAVVGGLFLVCRLIFVLLKRSISFVRNFVLNLLRIKKQKKLSQSTNSKKDKFFSS